MQNEKFQAKIWRINESLVVTIPTNIVKYSGYSEGDVIEIICKKMVK